TYLGATGEPDARSGARTLVIDIGGGSTELAIGSGRELEFRVSTQAGVVRQTERHLRHDPPTATELGGLTADVQAIMAASIPSAQRNGAQRGIAVAGTPTSLAAIAQALEPYDAARVHGWVLAADECDRILGELSKLPLAERRAVPGLHPDRAPTIVAGIVILRVALSLFGLDRIEVSEHGILRGAILHLILARL
ncbi:MAG: Ppx/GppA phosphatase family protein, partial [Solirubrobacteraceae bacterium]